LSFVSFYREAQIVNVTLLIS